MQIANQVLIHRDGVTFLDDAYGRLPSARAMIRGAGPLTADVAATREVAHGAAGLAGKTPSTR